MKKQTKKVISLCLAIAMLVMGYSNEVVASETIESYVITRINELPNYDDTGVEWFIMNGNENERSTPSLTSCSISIGCSSSGLSAEFYTNCSHVSEEVGVRDIKIQKKVGIFWSTVATSDGGSCGDSSIYGGSILYSNAEYGETYRVSCVHFAYCGGYDLQGENVTDGVKFTY